MFSSLRGHGRRRWFALGGVLLVVAVGVVAAVVLTSQPGDVSNPGVQFTQEPPPSGPAPQVPKGKHPMDDGFAWPDYHYTKARTGFLPLNEPLRPPFVKQWSVTGRILLEFTPVICRRSLYLLKNNGALYRISRLTGKVKWKKKLGYLAASSPACSGGTVYATLLERGKGIHAGRIVALDTKDGRTRWSRKIPSRAESSPLIASGRLYFGSEDGTVYALRASDGAIRWRYRAGGAVKSGLALADGKLYFGDYAGKVTALRRTDGHRIWRSSAAGSAFGLRSGNFYATPAVAYGRVYIGSLDGFVYSFGSADGKLAWRHKTGGFVYSSPAVADVAGVGPTVYAGSYDGKLYAFDARSGSVRWTHSTGGKISGGPVVIGDLVFYSNLSRRSTGAVGAATGRLMWSIGSGGFNPAISDGRRLYIVGYSSLFMLSSPAQARRDARARHGGTMATAPATASRAARSNAAAERARKRRIGRRVALRRRAQQARVARRVAARRAQIRRNARLRRQGRPVCFRRGGRTVCRIPRPLVCVKRPADGRTVCRARRKG
jgi:outer membrane protein assembly factor BamB